MAAANPQGINGPRQGRRTGRLRNTMLNVASKRQSPSGRRLGQDLPSGARVGPVPMPTLPGQPGGMTQTPFDPKQQQPNIRPLENMLRTLQQQTQTQAAASMNIQQRMQQLLMQQVQQMAQTMQRTGRGRAGGQGGNRPLGRGGTPEANRQLGRAMARRQGWGGQQWQALSQLWERESGWRHTAANPSSSARGIPQAMMSVHFGSGWQNNQAASRFLRRPRAQIRWGLDYIRQRYGSPMKAWQHFQRHNWY